MISKTIAARRAVMALVLACAALLGQQKLAPATPAAGIEFPVIMQQNVVAGKTLVGTKVQAKLAVATLVNGVVVPAGAIFSGQVTESMAKSANTTSRLSIFMDSAQWENGSTPIKAYLTAWYYPLVVPRPDLSSGQPDAGDRSTIRMGGAFPGNRTPTPLTFPQSPNDVPPSSIAQHRVLMKNVASTCNSDGAVTLTSKRSHLKLDNQTTYVFATNGPLLPAR